MKNSKHLVTVIVAALLTAFTYSCSDDTQSSDETGKVLLAEVAKDSVGAILGSSIVSKNVSTGKLDFTDRDSAEISFFYTGNTNNSAVPLKISFTSTSGDSVIYSASGLNLNSAENELTVTLPSPRVKEYFFYTLKVTAGAAAGFFKIRSLKIYKK
jgi:hypothetical protein